MDEGSFLEVEDGLSPRDFLNFKDYKDKPKPKPNQNDGGSIRAYIRIRLECRAVENTGTRDSKDRI